MQRACLKKLNLFRAEKDNFSEVFDAYRYCVLQISTIRGEGEGGMQRVGGGVEVGEGEGLLPCRLLHSTLKFALPEPEHCFALQMGQFHLLF